jgi:hypothetical protein
MPFMCYSYPGNVPSDSTRRDASREARRGLRKMPNPCYSYPNMCFSYPGDEPWDTPSREAAPPLPGLRQMPGGPCFRYPTAGEQPGLPAGTYLSYPVWPCFRY